MAVTLPPNNQIENDLLQQLRYLHVPELGGICTMLGKSKSGLKAVLFERVANAIRAEASKPDFPLFAARLMPYFRYGLSYAHLLRPTAPGGTVLPAPQPNAAPPTASTSAGAHQSTPGAAPRLVVKTPSTSLAYVSPAPTTAPAPAPTPPAAAVVFPPEAGLNFRSGNSATRQSWRRNVCVCGGVPDRKGKTTWNCCTIGCDAMFHGYCIGVGEWSESQKEWRCPLCRIGAMMPMVEVDAVLTGPTMILKNATASKTLTWNIPFGTMDEFRLSGRCVRLVSMKFASAAPSCAWPVDLTIIRVNSSPLCVPVTPANGSAPMLDITAQCRQGENTLNFEMMRNRESENFAIMCVVVKSITTDTLIKQVISRRSISAYLAADAMAATLELSRRPGGTWRGAATTDLSSLYYGALMKNNFLTAPAPHSGVTTAVDIEVTEIPVKLRDPLTWSGLTIPVRGDTCRHLNCVDLKQYLALNSKPSSRWKCPYCKKQMMPMHLWVDSVQLEVMRQASTHVPPVTQGSLAEVIKSIGDTSNVSDRGWCKLAPPAPLLYYSVRETYSGTEVGRMKVRQEGVELGSEIAGSGIQLSDATGDLHWSTANSRAAEGGEESELDDDTPLPKSSGLPFPSRAPSGVVAARQPAASNVIDLVDSEDEARASTSSHHAGDKRSRQAAGLATPPPSAAPILR